MFGVVSATRDEVGATLKAAQVTLERPQMIHFVESPAATLGLLINAEPDAGEALSIADDAPDCAAVSGWITPDGQSPDNTEAPMSLLAMARDGSLHKAHEMSGLFVAAIWRGCDGHLRLMSDWIGGIHQLFYAPTPRGLIFGTQLHTLIETAGWDGLVDQRALAQYLDFGHVLPPGTLFQRVSKLPAGCEVSYHDGKLQLRRTYRPRFSRNGSIMNAAARLRDVHRAAVQRCMRSSSEIGAFLSGGLDSSLNVAVMSEVSDSPVHTFSVAYPGTEIDESSYARLVADHFETEHHELALESAAVLDELPEMVWALEEPAMDYSFIPTFNLARFARSHVAAAISGDGPDHLFGRHYPVALIRSTLGRLPGMGMLASTLTEGDLGIAPRLRGSSGGRLLWKALRSAGCGSLQAYLEIYREIACRGLLPERTDYLLRDPEHLTICDDGVDPIIAEIADVKADEFQRTLALDLAIDGSCGVFAKVGKMAGYHGLTVHEPYLDAQVRDLIDTLPTHLKARGSILDLPGKGVQRKVLLYEAARGVLPDEVLSKPKQGFRAPIADWLREWIEGRDAEALLPALTGEIALVRADRVTDLLREHLSGASNHETLIMMLITLDLWYAIFVLGNARKPSWRWSEWLHR